MSECKGSDASGCLIIIFLVLCLGPCCQLQSVDEKLDKIEQRLERIEHVENR